MWAAPQNDLDASLFSFFSASLGREKPNKEKTKGRGGERRKKKVHQFYFCVCPSARQRWSVASLGTPSRGNASSIAILIVPEKCGKGWAPMTTAILDANCRVCRAFACFSTQFTPESRSSPSID